MTTQAQSEVRVNRAFAPLVSWSWPERYLLLTGGRGSGKSFGLALALAMLLREPAYRVLFTRYTLTSAEDSIIPEFMAKTELLGISEEFEAVGQNVRHKTSGSEILFRGIKTSSGNQTAKLKSLQGINVLVIEEAEELPDENTFDTIDLSVRTTNRPNKVILAMNPGHVAHWLYKRFWEPGRMPEEFSGAHDGVRYIHTSYEQNRPNLAPDFLAQAARVKASNPARYRHIFRGHWSQDLAGALWSYSMIQPYRVDASALPAMRRIVVAVDPAATSKADSDDTGIVVAGVGVDGHYYILDDDTCHESPLGWARRALAAFTRRGADRIVGEVNNGGEMVEATLRQADPRIPYRAVHASRGKILRAEPVAALYEQGLVHHAGVFDALECELMTYTGREGEKSPNRMDALVWALTDLIDHSVFGVVPASDAPGEDQHEDEDDGRAWNPFAG